MTRPTRVWLIVAVLALASAPVSAAAASSLKVGYVRVLATSPVVLADALHLFEKQGLSVELTPFGSGPALMSAFASGKLDAAWVGFNPVLVWVGRGAPIKVIAQASNLDLSLVVPAASGTDDLRGRTIGVLPSGSTPDVVLRGIMLPALGLSSKDVTIVPTAAPTLVAGLASGRLDAAVLLQPWTALAQAQVGTTTVLDVRTIWPQSVGGVVAVQERVWKDPAIVAKLRAVERQAVAFFQDHPAQADRLLGNAFFPDGIDTPSGHESGQEVMAATRKTLAFDDTFSAADRKALQRYIDIVQQLGYLNRPVRLDDILAR